MRRTLLLLALSLQYGFSSGHEMGRPVGKNCELRTPPTSAGEEFNHGITIKIYPRARNIHSRYTGCQIVWVPHEKQWEVISITWIESGDPTRIWSPDPSDPIRYSCTYRNGRVISGDEMKCAAPQVLIKGSMAPGCVAKIQKAVARDAERFRIPPGCDYD